MHIEEHFLRLLGLRKEIHLKVTATITVKIVQPDLVVPDQSLPDGKVGVPFDASEKIKIVGGAPGPDVVTLQSDPSTVPTGCTLLDDGTLSGTPTTPGTFVFQVGVAD